MVWHLGMLSHVYTKKLPSVASNSSGDISQSIPSRKSTRSASSSSDSKDVKTSAESGDATGVGGASVALNAAQYM